MKINRHTTFFLLLFMVTQGTMNLSAQNNISEFIIPKTNSSTTVYQTIASSQIEITYNRPNKRGREIFGSLIPYGEIWRTGSDEATEIYFSTRIKVQDLAIDSGRYELFTIPNKNNWEIILQKNLNQWGSYRYNKENDVIRFSVVPQLLNTSIETFTISIDQVTANGGILNIAWDNIRVPIKLNLDLKSTVIPQLEKLLLSSDKPPYFQAALFYYENNIDINRAAELMAKALEKNPEHIGMLYRQALILKSKGDINEAIIKAQLSYDLAQKANPELKSEYSRLNLTLLENLKSMKP